MLKTYCNQISTDFQRVAPTFPCRVGKKFPTVKVVVHWTTIWLRTPDIWYRDNTQVQNSKNCEIIDWVSEGMTSSDAFASKKRDEGSPIFVWVRFLSKFTDLLIRYELALLGRQTMCKDHSCSDAGVLIHKGFSEGL